MSTVPEAAPPTENGVRNYQFFCFCALVSLGLVLLQRGVGAWCLFPVGVGLVPVLFRWRVGPLLLLLSLAATLFVTSAHGQVLLPRRPVRSTPVSDLMLSAAVLAYVAGHYRLQGLAHFIFPRDPRRLPAAPAKRGLVVPAQRSPGLATPAEMVLLLLSLPVWAGIALFCSPWLIPAADEPRLFEVDGRPPLEFMEQAVVLTQFFLNGVWRCRLLVWFMGAGLLLASGLFGYLAWGRLNAAEALLYLQDTAWGETRREQRLLHSWLVWARRRRKEG
jgi:hypothetical protein